MKEKIEEQLIIIRDSIHALKYGKDRVTIHPADQDQFRKLTETIDLAVMHIASIVMDK